jgi:hypothetical protein
MADPTGREAATLHYGPTLAIELDHDAARQIREEIGAHATRGGWVSVTDRNAKVWTMLITPGIPIWFDSDSELTR